MDRNRDWASDTLKEAPFWVSGMTPEEYDREREYYLSHYDEIRSGKMEYVPLHRRETDGKGGKL